MGGRLQQGRQRSDAEETSAATAVEVMKLRRRLRASGRSRPVLARARIRATLAERSADPQRRYQALIEEAAAALAEAERVPGAPFTPSP